MEIKFKEPNLFFFTFLLVLIYVNTEERVRISKIINTIKNLAHNGKT